MNDIVQKTVASLLAPVDVELHTVQKTLGQTICKAVDLADIFLQSRYEESWQLEEGIVKEADYSFERGFGLRVISGEKISFAYADEIDAKALRQAARSAANIAANAGSHSIQNIKTGVTQSIYPVLNPIDSMLEKDKVALLQRMDRYARRRDPRVKQVIISLSGEHETVLLLNSIGDLVADIRPLIQLVIRVYVEHKGRREVGLSGVGARSDYRLFAESGVAFSCVDKAVDQALTNLTAVPPPAGSFPVVLGSGWPAVLLHEAVGHGLEGDFNRKGSSAFSGRLGQLVASPLCTIIDDGTIPNRSGSMNVDDEGTITQHTTLIENGILKNYMQDRHNADLMKMKATGNGRRESYAHLPIPRMTNTYLCAGISEPEEIIASVKHGIYAVDFSGGQVDITSGNFVFSTSEAYLITNGKISHPIKGATLIGNGPDVLQQISMVGNDLALDAGLGTCGKAGQNVPVGVGQPTVKVDKLTVGGIK